MKIEVFLLMVSAVWPYNIYSIGNDTEYISIIEHSINDLPGLNFYYQFESFYRVSLLDPNSIDILIVFNDDAIQKGLIESFASTYQIPSLFLSYGISKNFTFYSDFSDECYVNTIVSLTEKFSLSKPGIIWAYSPEILNIVEKVHNGMSEFLHISFLDFYSSSEISVSLIKLLKKEGAKNFFILPHRDYCEILIQGFKKAYLDSKGNVAILFTTCIYQNPPVGSLILTYESFESILDLVSYKKQSIEKFLKVFSENYLSPNEASRRLKLLYKNDCTFSILNIQEEERKMVGKIENSLLQLNDSIKFFGGIQDLTNYTKPTITISANTGWFNPNGAGPAYANVGNQEGTYFAVEKINRDKSYFPNFKLELYDKVDCGVSVFDYNYSKNCFIKHRPNMGIAYIPTFYTFTLPLLKQLYSLNNSIQFIGGIGSSGLLSSKKEYPYFLRTVSPSSDFASAWANLIRLYGWTKIIGHYTNDSFGTTAYKILNSSQEDYGFEFINEEKYRGVEYIYTYESLNPYFEFMKNSMSLGYNIIFLMMGDPTPYFWLEGFYDLGVRRGDYTFIIFTVTGLTNFNQANANVEKRKELMHGTFTIYNGAWVGEYGQAVKQEYLKYRSDAWGRSYFIDAVFNESR